MGFLLFLSYIFVSLFSFHFECYHALSISSDIFSSRNSEKAPHGSPAPSLARNVRVRHCVSFVSSYSEQKVHVIPDRDILRVFSNTIVLL